MGGWGVCTRRFPPATARPRRPPPLSRALPSCSTLRASLPRLRPPLLRLQSWRAHHSHPPPLPASLRPPPGALPASPACPRGLVVGWGTRAGCGEPGARRLARLRCLAQPRVQGQPCLPKQQQRGGGGVFGASGSWRASQREGMPRARAEMACRPAPLPLLRPRPAGQRVREAVGVVVEVRAGAPIARGCGGWGRWRLATTPTLTRLGHQPPPLHPPCPSWQPLPSPRHHVALLAHPPRAGGAAGG